MSDIFNIKSIALHIQVKSFLKAWTAKSEACGIEGFYAKRIAEQEKLYLDLYWHVMSKDKKSSLGNLYYRCSMNQVQDLVNKIEEEELPELIKKIAEERT